MENTGNWAKALKISPESLEAWKEEAPSHMPLVVWCLREGKIAMEDYFDWAVEAYGLPHLNTMFFNEAFFPEKLTKYAEQDSWTPWFFPVATWDNVVTVACVEPPHERLEEPHSFVLCDPQVLAEMFQRFQAGEANPVEEMPQEVLPDTHPGIAAEVPTGLHLNAKKFTLDLDLDSAMPKEAGETVEPQEFEELVSPTSAMEDDPSDDPASEPSLLLMGETSELGALHPPPLAPKKVVAPQSSAASPKMIEMINQAFENLKAEYQTTLVMRCEDQTAAPFCWPEEMTEIVIERAQIDLTQPSLFRIVARTLQPYHGYVVNSPIHEDFFSSLNLIVVPSCVTAAPIMVHGELWGMLVALGADSAQTSEALNHVRECADRLGTGFNNEKPAHEAA